MGICTPSYLSWIEKNHTVLDEEIYSLIFEKLELDYDKILSLENNLDEQLEKWLENVTSEKGIVENVEEIRQLAVLAGEKVALKFEIVYCRYLLSTDQIELAGQYIHQLERTFNIGNDRISFLYAIVSMIYFLRVGNYSKVIRIGRKLMETNDFETLGKDEEKGIFYYHLALGYRYLFYYEKAIHFAKKALELFNEGYYLNRAIDCHILLGICYNNLGKWNLAVKSYSMANRILIYLPKNNQNRYLSMINNNIGYSYEIQGDIEKAIHYYLQCLHYDENNKDKMVTFINLIRCYYISGNSTIAEQWLDLALNIKDWETPEKYVKQLAIFAELLFNKNITLYEITRLETAVMDYFQSERLWDLVIFYGNLFADLYEKYHQYKEASSMYKLVLQAYENLFERR